MIQELISKLFKFQVLFDLEVFIKRTSLPRLRLIFGMKRIQFKILMLKLARNCSLLWSIGVSGVSVGVPEYHYWSIGVLGVPECRFLLVKTSNLS